MKLKKKIGLLISVVFCLFAGVVLFFNNGNTEEKSPHTSEHPVQQSSMNDIEGLIPAVPARVNGVEIKRYRVEGALKGMIERYKMMGQAVDHGKIKEFVKELIDNLVIEELIFQQGKSLKVTVNKGDLDKEFDAVKARFPSDEALKKALQEQDLNVEILRKEMKRSIAIEKIVKVQIDDKILVDEKDAKKYYDDNKDRMTEPPSVKASHILVKVTAKSDEKEKKKAREKIEGVLKKVKDGKDFGQLAKDFSEGPSASKGGDLGYFSRGMMVPTFEKAAFSLQTGETSDIVETPFGYHLIKVFDKRDGKLQALEEVKEKIIEFLKMKKRQEFLAVWVETLKKKAKIEVLL